MLYGELYAAFITLQNSSGMVSLMVSCFVVINCRVNQSVFDCDGVVPVALNVSDPLREVVPLEPERVIAVQLLLSITFPRAKLFVVLFVHTSQLHTQRSVALHSARLSDGPCSQ